MATSSPATGGKPEGFLYAKWRTEAGPSWWWRSLLRVFLLQGLLMWSISVPLPAAQIGATSATPTALHIS